MERCPLPIEVCEFIIDLIPGKHWRRSERDDLRNCALTCRAWRARAQRRLWELQRLLDATSIDRFITEIRHVPPHLAALVQTLAIRFEYGDSICRLNELLMASRIPNLRTLELYHATNKAQLESMSLNLRLIHPRVLRTRPPLLAYVTKLKLSACYFGSLRAMLDVIWACPNLSSLKLESVWDFLVKTPVAEDAPRILLSSRRHLGACGKLTDLSIDLFHLPVLIPDGLYPIFNVPHGSLFGTHVTYLDLHVTPHDVQHLTNFLPGVFPALTTLRVVVNRGAILDDPPPVPSLSVLRLLAERTAAPSKCRKVVLICGGPALLRAPTVDLCRYCVFLFGQGHDRESMVESGDIFRRRFASLEELCLVIDEGHPKRCAARIQSMLPNLRGILTVSREWQ